MKHQGKQRLVSAILSEAANVQTGLRKQSIQSFWDPRITFESWQIEVNAF